MVTRMSRGGFHERRRERMHQLLRYIVANSNGDKTVKANEMVAHLTFRLGVTRKKLDEYLRELRTMGAIKGSDTLEATKFGKTLVED